MLRADVVVVQAARLIDGQLYDLLGTRSEADIAGAASLTLADDELDGRAHLAKLDVQVGQNASGDAVRLTHKPQQYVLRPDVVVV